MDRFGRTFAAYRTGGFAAFRDAFECYSLLKVRVVRFESGTGVSRGRVLGVDDEGRLMVETSHGRALLSAGDVRLSPES
jgi:biotin-(acetyl-CoA carboxylase) ligase